MLIFLAKKYFLSVENWNFRKNSKQLTLNFKAKNKRIACTFCDVIWHWVKFGLFLLRLKGLGCKKVSSESFEGKKGGVFFRKRWRERERKQGKTALKLLEKNALWHYWAWDGLALESCDVEALTAERKKNLQPTIEGPPKTGQPISDRLETSKSYQTPIW